MAVPGACFAYDPAGTFLRLVPAWNSAALPRQKKKLPAPFVSSPCGRGQSWKCRLVSINDENNVARVAIEAQCTVKVYYKYTNEDHSFYDKEDGVYLWQEVIEIEESYKVELNLTISLDISNCGIDTEEEKEYVEFMDYVDCLTVRI